jgi:hypothetical protein
MIKSRRMRLVGYVVCMGKIRNGYRVLVGNSHGKRSCQRPVCRRKDIIKTDFRKMGCEGMDSNGMAHNRFADLVNW